MDAVDHSAPAPESTPDTPDTMSATAAAVVADNYADFEAAEFAKSAGKPLPDVEAPPPTAERTLSKRQQEANERTQKAVEAATADLRAENERLKKAAQSTPPPAAVLPAPAADGPKPERFMTFEQYVAKTPEATLEDFMDARDEFRDQQRERTSAQRTELQSLHAADAARAARVHEQMQARVTEDPAFLTKVNPRILTFKSIADSHAAGVPVTPGSLVLEEMMGSDAFLPIVDHFTAHPDALARLEKVPDHLAQLPPRQRAIEHGRWIVREMAKLETKLTPALAVDDDKPAAVVPPKPKTISSAPPPPADIGRRSTTPADPIAAAVKADDFAAFEQAEFDKVRAARK